MAQATNNPTISRFHNLPDNALADAIGHADAILKGAEAECKSLKDEFKRRGLAKVSGESFTVTATEQIAGRLDTKAVKVFLGDSYHRFEKPIVSTFICISSSIRDPFVRAAFERVERDEGVRHLPAGQTAAHARRRRRRTHSRSGRKSSGDEPRQDGLRVRVTAGAAAQSRR